MTIRTVNGKQLLRLRAASIGRRFKFAKKLLHFAFKNEFGIRFFPFDDDKSIKFLDMFLKQANNVGGERKIGNFFFDMEGKLAKRIVLFKMDYTLLKDFKDTGYLQAIQNRGLSSKMNNKNIEQVTITPFLTSISVDDSVISLRWSQLRYYIKDNNPNYYFYSVKAKISIKNGLCIFYFDNRMIGGEESWNVIINEYRQQLANFIGCQIDDIAEFTMGWGLESKLVEVMNASNIQIYKRTKIASDKLTITGFKFYSEAGVPEKALNEHDDGFFRGGDIEGTRERLADPNIVLQRLHYKQKYTFNKHEREIHLDLSSKGEFQSKEGLLIEEEMDYVIAEFLRRSAIASRPIFKYPAEIETNPAV